MLAVPYFTYFEQIGLKVVLVAPNLREHHQSFLELQLQFPSLEIILCEPKLHPSTDDMYARLG